VRDYALGVARVLRRAVAFDGFCLLTIDPATHLPTSEIVQDGLPPSASPRMAEIEMREPDVNKFAALRGRGAATLSGATAGELDRSTRHRELKRPHGFGDELRAPLASWGALTLLRLDTREPFAPADAAAVDALCTVIAEGLRRATLLPARPPARDAPPGMLLLGADGALVQADAAAGHWLDVLDARAKLPTAVLTVAAGGTARVRAPSGEWVLVRGFGVGEQTAVLLEPARAPELAPLIAEAYDLTERERAVTELVAQGLPTGEIASTLFLSPWTVQDHLKSIFEKVGVRTRGELIARVFFADEAPRLS